MKYRLIRTSDSFSVLFSAGHFVRDSRFINDMVESFADRGLSTIFFLQTFWTDDFVTSIFGFVGLQQAPVKEEHRTNNFAGMYL